MDMNIKTIFRYLMEEKSLQGTINRMYQPSERGVIISPANFDFITTKTGERFHVTRDISTVEEVIEDYQFDDIREDDIVIDIGACIGGFTIPAAKMAKRVVAVEPVMADELISNLRLNDMEGKVSVIFSPLGNGSTVTASWSGKMKSKKSLRFVTIKLFAGGCDFLKCDCEGAEWCLTHDDLKDIRRIEMELHEWGNPNMGLIKRLMTTHETEITPVGNKARARRVIGILHARRRE